MVVYWITNGRSTSPFSLESLKRQQGRHTIVEVHDKPVPDSFNEVLKCTDPYFTMCGDDFVLHPAALNYIEAIMLHRQPNTGMICWRLWDPLMRRSIEGIKAYSTEAVRSVGGFRLDHRRKMDNNMWFDLKKAGFRNYKDPYTVLGVHIHGSIDDLNSYEQKWGHVKPYRWQVMSNKMPLRKQIDLGFKKMNGYNKAYRNPFWKKNKK